MCALRDSERIPIILFNQKNTIFSEHIITFQLQHKFTKGQQLIEGEVFVLFSSNVVSSYTAEIIVLQTRNLYFRQVTTRSATEPRPRSWVRSVM